MSCSLDFSGLLGSGWVACLIVLTDFKECGSYVLNVFLYLLYILPLFSLLGIGGSRSHCQGGPRGAGSFRVQQCLFH